jgi:glyoxylase-like metal-dependent hydrolase (beta-lactamase superfamily II)
VKLKSFALTPFYTNCYVLKDGGEALVIDPGEAAPELLAEIAGCKVVMIVNTHCHCDHAGGNAGMVEATGAPLAMHRAELPLLHTLEQQGAMFGVPFPPSPDPDRFLEEGDLIQVGAVSLKVRYAPGHSPGHIVLIGDGFAFVGDDLFAGSIGRTDLPGGSHDQLLDSIRTKLMTLPDETQVYSGHGPSTTIGIERATNPFLV